MLHPHRNIRTQFIKNGAVEVTHHTVVVTHAAHPAIAWRSRSQRLAEITARAHAAALDGLRRRGNRQ